MAEERVNPIRVTDKKSGEVYTLDFCKESIKFAEAREFQVEDVTKYFVSKMPEFFYYAFRMHHRGLSRTQTDAIYERLGGVSPEFFARLVALYNQAQLSNNVVDSTEDMGKNGNMAVEL